MTQPTGPTPQAIQQPEPDLDPDQLVEAATDAAVNAGRLVDAARSGARAVMSPDGRQLIGEAILVEADRLRRDAALDAALATALLLVQMRDTLTDMRQHDVGFAPRDVYTGRGFTIPREMLAEPEPIPHPGSATPEDAPTVSCPLSTYHSNHLWWGPPSSGGTHQPRFFCNGVRWPDVPAARIGD